MENIEILILSRFKTLSMLIVSMTLCMVLLMIRKKVNHSFFFLFLVWNLFLAIDIIIHPTIHLQAWVFTLTFGAFLNVGYWMVKAFSGMNTSSV